MQPMLDRVRKSLDKHNSYQPRNKLCLSAITHWSLQLSTEAEAGASFPVSERLGCSRVVVPPGAGRKAIPVPASCTVVKKLVLSSSYVPGWSLER
eukprot:5080185-Amphidinium_carterae.1